MTAFPHLLNAFNTKGEFCHQKVVSNSFRSSEFLLIRKSLEWGKRCSGHTHPTARFCCTIWAVLYSLVACWMGGFKIFLLNIIMKKCLGDWNPGSSWMATCWLTEKRILKQMASAFINSPGFGLVFIWPLQMSHGNGGRDALLVRNGNSMDHFGWEHWCLKHWI